MSAKCNAGGFRLDDCRQLFGLHNLIMSEVSRMSPNDDATVLRRLRVLAFWISSMGNAAFEDDPWAAGMADADDFWRRRQLGERGNGDAVE